MKTISLTELKKRNYDKKLIESWKLKGDCILCLQKFEYSTVGCFLRNRVTRQKDRGLWDTCSKCWYSLRVSTPEWKEKNRQAQLIAQNKPEQKIKNGAAVAKSWTKERRTKNSLFMKERWSNDPEFAQTALKNLSWTSTNNQKFHQTLNKSIGRGGLRGKYKNLYYNSALELSYILWCESLNIEIKNYDLEPIQYYDENQKLRNYYPDFIVNNNEIIEIKGLGLYYHKNYQRNLCKIEAASKLNKKYKIVFSNDKCVSFFYKTARTIHHNEIKNQKNDSV